MTETDYARAEVAPVVVAIDGPAASGKGTLAKALAKHYNLFHLDTGMLYRTVGLKALEKQIATDNEDALAELARVVLLDGTPLPMAQLRSDEVGQAASQISVLKRVRSALSDAARECAAHPPPGYQGAILDGRDVGTVLCPTAAAKMYLVASPEARADRRYKELLERQPDTVNCTSYDQVLK
eukprot:gene27472-4778_t